MDIEILRQRQVYSSATLVICRSKTLTGMRTKVTVNVPVCRVVMRKFIFAAAFCLAFVVTRAQEGSLVIEPERGERWWGVYAGGGPSMPFAAPFAVDATVAGSGLVPILVSDDGRYFQGAPGTGISFDGRKFTLRGDSLCKGAVKAGKTLREAYIVCAHTNFPPSDKVPAAELFSMPVYLTAGELGAGHTQEGVLDYARRIVAGGFPAGIVVIPAGWDTSDGIPAFDQRYYPDPGAMCRELHGLGFRVMLTVTPLIGASGRSYRRAADGNMLICSNDGAPFTGVSDEGCQACIDLVSNRVAVAVKQGLESLYNDYGIDGFRFDLGDCLPFISHLGDESRTAFMQNWAGLGDLSGLCLYSSVVAMPSFPYVCESQTVSEDGWKALGEAMDGPVAMGLCGYAYPTANLYGSGNKTSSDAALMVRSLLVSASMPVCIVGFAPWRLAGNDLKSVKDALAQRARLAEYITETARESSKTAEPLVRHMEYQFPRNGFADCRDQFMLGPRYLFAPAVDSSATRTVRLPRGTWIDRNGKRYKGPVVARIDVSGGRLQWFELTGGK